MIPSLDSCKRTLYKFLAGDVNRGDRQSIRIWIRRAIVDKPGEGESVLGRMVIFFPALQQAFIHQIRENKLQELQDLLETLDISNFDCSSTRSRKNLHKFKHCVCGRLASAISKVPAALQDIQRARQVLETSLIGMIKTLPTIKPPGWNKALFKRCEEALNALGAGDYEGLYAALSLPRGNDRRKPANQHEVPLSEVFAKMLLERSTRPERMETLRQQIVETIPSGLPEGDEIMELRNMLSLLDAIEMTLNTFITGCKQIELENLLSVLDVSEADTQREVSETGLHNFRYEVCTMFTNAILDARNRARDVITKPTFRAALGRLLSDMMRKLPCMEALDTRSKLEASCGDALIILEVALDEELFRAFEKKEERKNLPSLQSQLAVEKCRSSRRRQAAQQSSSGTEPAPGATAQSAACTRGTASSESSGTNPSSRPDRLRTGDFSIAGRLSLEAPETLAAEKLLWEIDEYIQEQNELDQARSRQ